MVIKFYEELLLRIRKRQLLAEERLTTGSFQSFEDYKNVVGLLEGLKSCEKITKDLYQAMFETIILAKEGTKDGNEAEFY